MVRRYDTNRPVPPEIVDRIVRNGLRAPSAGFSQGWGFLVLDDPADIARFREAARSELDPDGWFAAEVQAPGPHAELIALRVLHEGVTREARQHGGPRPFQPGYLVRHGPGARPVGA
jgi:nitroreductase